MTPYTWRRGDSLSTLAAGHGLDSWRRIWNDAANDALRAQRGSPENLRPGDIVNIPDRQPGEVARATGSRHEFVRVGVPPASIRFISDAADPVNPNPTELDVLQVSTVVTTLRLPSGFTQPSMDPRNFKVEVTDLGAGGGTVNAEIEAFKPMLDAQHRPQRDADGELTFESFSPRRMLAVQCQAVAGLPHVFRSKYLRLVTDEKDLQAKPAQTLLTDHDPGDLNVEILDQRVIARYTATSGEAIAAQAEVGDAELRMRTCIFVCRTSAGAGGLVGGVTADDVERHLKCWVRRTYAAANMSPRLMNPVAVVDPVENLICIHSRSRRNAQGGGEVRFRINTAPAVTTVSVITAAAETPRAIADRLAAAAQASLPADYTVEVFDNPEALNRTGSADILVRGPNVIVSGERSLDGRIGIGAGRVRPGAMHVASLNDSNVGALDNRALARNYRTNPRAVAVFVIGRFTASSNAVGFAYGKQFRERPEVQGTYPMAGCCFVEARTTARADQRVHTMDHEMGHILIDMVHFSGRATELMTDAPVQLANSVNDSKRLSGWTIPYREYVRGAMRNYPINPNDEIRTREAAQYIEGWDAMLSE
jgi:hypothetical protein